DARGNSLVVFKRPKKGKLIKPYNSILGEQFFCYWEVTPPSFDEKGNLAASPGVATSNSQSKHRVTCINEQISHHPPVSAFYYHCEEKGVTACGLDHISARFTGTSVKIGPGDRNKGIYLKLDKRDNEEYLMTHPVAAIQGWLKGSLYIVVGEACIVTCPKTKLKAILEYKEERWLGKPRFAIEGKIFKYDPENDDIKKLKSVDEEAVLCEVYGSWRGEVHAKIRRTNETRLVLNMEAIDPIPKIVKPIAEQGPLESRKVWQNVTSAILSKDYSHATKEKQLVEERQRQKAAAAKAKKEEFEPAFFKLPVVNGQPQLKDDGIQMLKQLNDIAN
ncbi:6888_t:CDS:2, partial [Paraglomus occultum]